MNFRQTIVSCSLALLATSCISNHQFAEFDEKTPDWQSLEQARQALPEDDRFGDQLVDLTWLPLLALQLQQYESSDPLLRKGNTVTDAEAYGPLVMFGDADQWMFDEQGDLYERREQSHALWGLWKNEETRVKVESGWRVESEASLLFGLLRWPTTVYVPSKPVSE